VIDRSGCYALKAAEYHRDPAPAPSLSASIARELLTASPHHAWCAHPRLNPAYTREYEDKFDLGTAVHAYLLEGDDGFVIVNEKDWRKDAAKGAREEARLDGKVALLRDQWVSVQAMAIRAREQLAGHEPPIPLTSGRPEQTLVWQEGRVWLRARLDWLHDDHRTIDDFKSTGASANPAAWTRTMFGLGADVQAALYVRGVKAVFGVEAEFRFVVQETYPPYALAVIGLAPEAMALAERKVAWAIARWGECLASGQWPSYPTRTCWAELPPWEATRWMEQEILQGPRGPAPVDDGRPIEELLFKGKD
jgi:hypothetical protein